jgi:hypothetical protein
MAAPEDGHIWVECYDPIVEENYYYCHATKETTYDAPEDYITAKEDRKMNAVIKIQCMGRKVGHPSQSHIIH